MRPICPDSRERKLNGAESGRSAAPRFRLLTAAMIKRLACLLPALLLPVLAAACAPVPPPEAGPASLDRKRGVSGKSVSVRVDLGGRRIIKKKKLTINHNHIRKKKKQNKNK